MKKTISRLMVGFFFLFACSTLWAVSRPIVYGSVFGIELCPQVLCHAAIFTGSFSGRVGNNFFAHGVITAALTHQDLPPDDLCSEITGGSWQLNTFFRSVSGDVQPHGLICNNADGTFAISATLLVDPPGSGDIKFNGVLNHNTLIPTFWGALSQ